MAPRIVAVSVVVVLSGMGAAYAVGHGRHAKARHRGSGGVTAVEVARARSGTAISSISLSGTVAATASLPLSTGTAGRVSAVNVTPGQAVHAGQTLASLADPVLAAQLTEAQAAVAAAQAKLAAAEAGPSPQAVGLAQAQVTKAQAAMQAAQAQGGGSKTQGSHARTGPAVAGAQAALGLAQAQAALAAAPPSSASLAPLQAAVTQAQDAEAVVQAEVAQDSLTAPFAGVVASVSAVVGQQVTAGTTLLTLDSAGLTVQAPVSQMDLAFVRQGEAATISVPGQQRALPGRVTAVSPAGNPSSFTFQVTVTPASVPSWLHPGEAASVAVVSSRVAGAVLVPASAVVSINGHPQVFTVGSGGNVALVDVTAGVSDGTTTAVNGLAAGTEVVSVGQTYLAPGDRVRVTGTTTVPAAITGSITGGLLTAPVTPASTGSKQATGTTGAGAAGSGSSGTGAAGSGSSGAGGAGAGGKRG